MFHRAEILEPLFRSNSALGCDLGKPTDRVSWKLPRAAVPAILVRYLTVTIRYRLVIIELPSHYGIRVVLASRTLHHCIHAYSILLLRSKCFNTKAESFFPSFF